MKCRSIIVDGKMCVDVKHRESGSFLFRMSRNDARELCDKLKEVFVKLDEREWSYDPI